MKLNEEAWRENIEKILSKKKNSGIRLYFYLKTEKF